MKTPVWSIFIFSLALALGARAERATMSVRVVDAETGAPLAGVSVEGSFARSNAATAWKGGLRPNVVKALTDANGCCEVTGETNLGRAKVWVTEPPEGYYPSAAPREYVTTGGKAGGHWLPEVVRETIPLQKTGCAVPLAWKKAELWKTKAWSFLPLAAKDEKFSASYDLFAGDWLPPFGKGEVADLVFTSTREVTGTEASDPRNPGKSVEFYTWRHTLAVPGKGNGIRALRPDPILPIRLRAGADEGLVPSVTRRTGLRKRVEGDRWYPVPFDECDRATVYSLRLRSAFDAEGRRVKAFYAMIERDFSVRFNNDGCPMSISFFYRLNPEANDRNLEWDGKSNLDPEAVRAAMRRETVDVAVPAHDPVAAAACVQKTIDERARLGGGKVALGPGEIEMSPLQLKEGVTLFLREGTTLLAATNAVGEPRALVSAEGVSDAGIDGRGRLAGGGAAPLLGRFVRCRNLRLGNFSFRTPGEGLRFESCDGVTLRNMTAFGAASNNLIRVASQNVSIEGCIFNDGGDALVLCPGGDAAGDVRKVEVGYCTFRGARRAVVLSVTDGGRLENVKIGNLDLKAGVGTPLVLSMDRSGASSVRRESVLNRVTLHNIRGRALSRIPCSVTGLPDLRPTDITLVNVRLTFPGGGTRDDPDPAWGFVLRHADRVTFDKTELTLMSSDGRERIFTDDASNLVR